MRKGRKSQNLVEKVITSPITAHEQKEREVQVHITLVTFGTAEQSAKSVDDLLKKIRTCGFEVKVAAAVY